MIPLFFIASTGRYLRYSIWPRYERFYADFMDHASGDVIWQLQRKSTKTSPESYVALLGRFRLTCNNRRTIVPWKSPPTTNTQVQNDRIAQPGNCSCLHGIAAGTSLSQSKSPNERCWASASQSWWPDASKVHSKGLQRRLWQQPQKGARTVTQHGPI